MTRPVGRAGSARQNVPKNQRDTSACARGSLSQRALPNVIPEQTIRPSGLGSQDDVSRMGEYVEVSVRAIHFGCLGEASLPLHGQGQ
jgi:hypothetical protein